MAWIIREEKPTIELRRISLPDIAGVDPSSQYTSNRSSVATQMGRLAPYAEVGNYRVMVEDVIDCTLDATGFLPKVTLTFFDKSGAYSGVHSPTDTPLLKLYAKSDSGVLGTYRIDFLIIDSVGTPQKTEALVSGIRPVVHTVTGEMFIPGIYDNSAKSFKGTSLNALKSIAKSLGLGWATNVKKTSDEMTWLKPAATMTMVDWMQEITSRAYDGEKTSFFTSFIDIHYNLNFVNVENALSTDTPPYEMPNDASAARHRNLQTTDAIVSDDVTGTTDYSARLIELTNSAGKLNNSTYILEYSLNSEHGKVLSQQGLRKNVIWHDRNEYLKSGKLLNHFFEPNSAKTEPGAELSVYQKPVLKNFEKEGSRRWLGIDYKNAHTHYKFAKLINLHNLEELNKNYLTVTLAGWSNFIIRGSKIRVIMVRTSSEIENSMEAGAKFKNSASTLARSGEQPEPYLSYNYYVMDMVKTYNGLEENPAQRWKTELRLGRREWIKPDPKDLTASEFAATQNTQNIT